MRHSIIYVHYEPIAHLFVTSGVSADDLIATRTPFRQLLVLPPIDDNLPLDPTTGFNLISGTEEVREFMRSREAREHAWLDADAHAYLREMTPNEIAELLYLAHARTHIQPPYYYKLQNQLVYVPSGAELTTLYVRQVRLFEQALGQAIARHLRLSANEQPFWLRLRGTDFPAPSADVLHPLLSTFEEGAMIDFGAATFTREQVSLPIYRVESHAQIARIAAVGGAEKLGRLLLQRETRNWQVLV